MPTLLTFGDSNTHGSRPIGTPGELSRYGEETRWPVLAREELGTEWRLVEEGLPGRTTQYRDPVMGDEMDGRVGLKIALRSHGPIDILTVMLGTNDLKTRFAPTPEKIVAGLTGLLDIALSDDMQARHDGFKILLISPPPIREQGPVAGQFFGGRAVSCALASYTQALATRRGVGFLDAAISVEVSAQDGVHWEADQHEKFGSVVADTIQSL